MKVIEYAELTGVSRQSVYQKIKNNSEWKESHCKSVGNQIMIDPESFDPPLQFDGKFTSKFTSKREQKEPTRSSQQIIDVNIANLYESRIADLQKHIDYLQKENESLNEALLFAQKNVNMLEHQVMLLRQPVIVDDTEFEEIVNPNKEQITPEPNKGTSAADNNPQETSSLKSDPKPEINHTKIAQDENKTSSSSILQRQPEKKGFWRRLFSR